MTAVSVEEKGGGEEGRTACGQLWRAVGVTDWTPEVKEDETVQNSHGEILLT